jgi:ankyrin repeat protein
VVLTTPLFVAAGGGRLGAVRLLLDAGADPSCAASDGPTPLMMAVGDGHLEVVRLLLARGAAVDAADLSNGRAAFHFACYNNQAACAEALVRAGCDVGLKDGEGKTGRELAEAERHAAVVARLRAVVAEQLRAAQVAVGPEPEPAAVVSDGGPAARLLKAAQVGDSAAVARLLAAGADPNASVAGRLPSGAVTEGTALLVSAGGGWLEAARLLLDGGADPDRAGGGGGTPLMLAAREGQLEVVRLLLARGAAVDAVRPEVGFTAFHYACFNNHPDCAEVLARAGCDVGIKDSEGKTGRALAEAEGHAAVVERLRAAAAAAGPRAPER